MVPIQTNSSGKKPMAIKFTIEILCSSQAIGRHRKEVMVNFETNSNCQYHMSSSERKASNTFEQWLGSRSLTPPSSLLSYVVAVGFIGGGDRSIRRKAPTCRKSLKTLFHNVVSNTPRLSGIQIQR
jgi:hypothetical protein